MGTKGYKSTEFWLNLAAILIAALLGSGALPVDGPVEKIVLMIASVLGALGYTVNRTLFKSAKIKAEGLAKAASEAAKENH